MYNKNENVKPQKIDLKRIAAAYHFELLMEERELTNYEKKQIILTFKY